MTKKRLLTSLVLLVVVGTVLVISQVVLAKDDGTKKQEPSQVSQTDHAAHHPEANDMMKDGNMQGMMKMMDTPEGKQMMEKCQELLKQNAEDKSTVQ